MVCEHVSGGRPLGAQARTRLGKGCSTSSTSIGGVLEQHRKAKPRKPIDVDEVLQPFPSRVLA